MPQRRFAVASSWNGLIVRHFSLKEGHTPREHHSAQPPSITGDRLPSQPLARRRRDTLILASGPVLGTAVGAVTNVITSSWNWWLFVSLVLLVSLCAAAATYLPAPANAPRPAGERAGTVSTLPPASAVFTGRGSALERLADHPARPRPHHRAAVFLITGEPGVGKTELAVQAAHRLTDRFPDAQLFLAFRSHGGQSSSLDVRDILLTALETFAPAVSLATSDIDRLGSSWRAATTDQQIVIILDDVVTAEQVLRLLPSSHGCLVITTARQFIVGIDPDLHLRLEGLSQEEAERMIGEIVRRASCQLPESTIRELAAVHRLPLTIRHAVDQLISGDGVPVGRLPTGRRETQVFATTFGRLPPRERLVLHRSSLYPGPHLTGTFAAALADISAAEAEEALTELHRLGLIHKPDPYGYGFHDLVRAMALTDGRDADSDREDELAISRLFQAALGVVYEVSTLINGPVVTSTLPNRGIASLSPMTESEALTWMSVHFDDLRSVIRLAIDRSWNGTWELVSGISYYMRFHRNIPQAEEFNRAALQIAVAAHDRLGQAVCQLWLGRLARTMSEYTLARSHTSRGLSLFIELDDVLGQATCHAELGYIDHHLARYEDSADHAMQAGALYRHAGNTRGRANSEGLLGMLGRLTGDYRGALEHLELALDLFMEIRNERNQAWIHCELGTIQRQTGAYEEARSQFRLAREISDRTGDLNGQAWADRELGIVARMTGAHDEALSLLSSALQVFTDLGGRRNIADALVELGTLHRVNGQAEAARTFLVRALSIYRDIGNRRGLAWTELELGALDRLTGAIEAAQEHVDQAMVTYTEIRDKSGMARTYFELGCLAVLRGGEPMARTHWERALALYESMGSPEADETRVLLSAL
ncbi:tetratricopeptide repeat protein [Streptomyces caniscabiei]|uniref:tetratricopeptide repeat protein n=1 Tax=Streptomyces caniscabiei TaxID=2746961 RepID=UPI0015C512FC|nr:tetratricopeptide repeat protein [Streptomyces caniscabiei]